MQATDGPAELNITGIIDAQGVQMTAPAEVRQDLVRVIGNALRVASALAPNEQIEPLEGKKLRPAALGLAMAAATQSVNTLFGAASVQCNLAAPPEDIEMKVNSGGRIVFRCYHNPAHEWDLGGNPLP